YENLVFLKIKNKKPEYYLENSVEIDFVTKEFVLEAKYNQELNDKQLNVFNSIKRKKIIAKGCDFFM
ncbi:MAG TPA: ATP-binding protein, partial [Candidatus Nanoarchaeia archaeon]|nr:ATP-binding protein [Candidatus Nanoarchaeia archaeon]